MKKPNHEEIIILQNYFKSMRAKTNGIGWVLGTGCCHSRCPATARPPPRAGLPGSRGQGIPKPPVPGLGKPGVRNTKEKQNMAQKSMASESSGDCQHGFWSPSSQDRQQLAPNSPAPRDEGWQLLLQNSSQLEGTSWEMEKEPPRF